jgi:predicted nucleic acid-binding protein
LRIRRYRHASLVTGIWSLRNKLTAYDAAYVTLARLLNATLVTRDERLASAAALEVSVTVP